MRHFLLFFAASGVAVAATFTGSVFDPQGAGIPRARVSAIARTGIVAETVTSADGAFRLELPENFAGRLIVTAQGFERAEVTSVRETSTVRLALAAHADSITVTASPVEAPVSEQGSSVFVIPRTTIEQRNEGTAIDLLRHAPGVVVNQNGQRGGVGAIFVRGGASNSNLIMIDGVPVNRFGGEFDLSKIPTSQLERVEVLRGPQSASYGPYANSGVVNFLTRLDASEPAFEALAEGGSHLYRRFALAGSGAVKRFEIAGLASRIDTDGEVDNSDFRNEYLSMNVRRRFGGSALTARASLNSNENGVPGPYGSDPAGLYGGLDLLSRNKFNWSSYLLRFTSDISPAFRQEFIGSFFLNNNTFESPYGPSYNKDWRGTGEARSLVSITPAYTLAAGVAFSREQVENTFITDNDFRTFPLHRDHTGIYVENRFELGSRFFVNAGLRLEAIATAGVPGNAASDRPDFPSNTIAQVNPRISAAYRVRPTTTVRSSFGTGIRPAGGFEIAFTNNPKLKPERTAGIDAVVEQRLFGNRLSLEGGYFYNRYYDLIVSLGGSLARLSSFRSDNLANSRAQGGEFVARARPHSALSFGATYTYLDSEILSLSGASNVAPAYFEVGQPLLRRPRHSGAVDSTFVWGRMSANAVAHFRGETLETEPNFGASAGLFPGPGYTWLGINLNVRVARGLTVYGNLRNALNERYEEVLGYPSPRLNFVSGIKWAFRRE